MAKWFRRWFGGSSESASGTPTEKRRTVTFRAFANAAAGDSGDASALKHLGYPVAHLAEAVLGEGLWQPKPELWKDGVERGQFGSRPRVDRYEMLRGKLH